MFQLKSVIFFASLCWPAFGNEPVFSVVGSKFLRNNELYKFSVSASELEKSLSFDFKISGVSTENKYFETILKNKKVKSGELVEFVADTSLFENGNYQLTVNAYDPYRKVNYTDTRQLTFKNRRYMILIQTDKAIYRGGDTVRYRVFSVDSETRSYSNASANLTLYDSNLVAMNVFPNVTFVNGKYEGSFKLSDVATLGQWKLAIKTSPQENYDPQVQKYFEVKNYVIPMIDVNIEAPSKVALSDNSFTVSVNAQYKNGQQVIGKVTVAFYVLTFNYYVSSYNLRYQKTFDLNNATTFDVLLRAHLQVYYNGNVRIDVKFIDDATQKNYDERVYTTIVPFKYNVNADAKSLYIQGKPYEFTVYVNDFNNKPAPAGLTLSWMAYSYNYYTWRYHYYQSVFTLDSGGSAKVIIDTSIFNSSSYISLNIYGHDVGADNYYANLYRREDYPLNVKVLTENPEIYSSVNIEATTSSNVSTGYYHMISKGLLVAAKDFDFVGGKANISFVPDFSYAPQTNIIFHYYDETGKAITKSTVIYVNTKTANYLDLQLVNANVKPGDNATLEIKSSLGSVVSLLAIDQNVLNLKSGNDLDKANVLAFTGLNWPSSLNQEWDRLDGESLFELNNFIMIKRKLSNDPPAIPSSAIPSSAIPSSEIPTSEFISSEVPSSEFPSSEVPSSEFPSSEVPSSQAPMSEPSSSQPAPALPAPPRIRQDFFETLLWEDVVIENPLRVNNKPDKVKGLENHIFTAPDSITSYVISGVAMSDKFGLGLPDLKPILKISMPFFIEMNLPYSVKRSEVLVQDIYIFNNLGQNQDATIIVERNDLKFDIIEPAFNNWTVSANSFSQSIVSTFNRPVIIVLAIKPLYNGFIDLKVKAIGNLAGDSISKPLRVVPNGVKKTNTDSVFISIPENQTAIFSHDLECAIPSSAYEEEISVKASIVGDLMGSVLENLGSLIQMPCGCGEQNMAYLVPDIVILMYLDTTNQLTPSIRNKLISYATIGYTHQLTYMHTDGSFSVYTSVPGSTWLTSYVAKAFILARKYIYIDPEVILKALTFVTSKQTSVGSFREDSRVFETYIQGGTSGAVTMAAYISITLTEALAEHPYFGSNRDLALTFVVNNIDHNNVFALAITSYALYLANHPSFNTIYSLFLTKSTESGTSMQWNDNIETTAYGLLLMQHLDVFKAMKISKYLISKRNAFGGYSNSQDTVVALQALASFATLSRATTGTLNLILTPNVGSEINAVVNLQNVLSLQQFDLNPSVLSMNVHNMLPSSGSAVVGLSCEYYEIINDPSPRFNIIVDTSPSCIGIMKSKICLNYIPNGYDDTADMPLVQMQLPSGYVYDIDTVLPGCVLKLEVLNGGSTVNLYLQSVSSQVCFNINAIQTSIVKDIKAAPIEVLNYYRPNERAQIMYTIPTSLKICGDMSMQSSTYAPSFGYSEFEPSGFWGDPFGSFPPSGLIL